MLKNQRKNYTFLKIFKEILRFFQNFLKSYRNVRENLGKNWENFLKYGFLWGSGGKAPRNLAEILKKLVKNQCKTAKF